MNEFERKLREQTFRAPPPDVRAALFDVSSPVADADAEPAPRWTWRDWLWPSPYAWGALAALWLIFGAMQWSGSIPASTPPAPLADRRAKDITLLTCHTPEELHYAFDY